MDPIVVLGSIGGGLGVIVIAVVFIARFMKVGKGPAVEPCVCDCGRPQIVGTWDGMHGA